MFAAAWKDTPYCVEARAPVGPVIWEPWLTHPRKRHEPRAGIDSGQ